MRLYISIAKMPKALDPFWQYADPEDGTNRQRLNCKLYGQHMTGGIRRLKYHLEKLLGHDLGLCSANTPEIMRMAHDAIHLKDRKREESATNRAELVVGGVARTSGTYDHPTEGSVGGSTIMDSPSVRVVSLFHGLEVVLMNLPSIRWLKKGRRKKHIGL